MNTRSKNFLTAILTAVAFVVLSLGAMFGVDLFSAKAEESKVSTADELAAAIANVQDGDIVTLEADLTTTTKLVVENKSFVLDLNDHTLTVGAGDNRFTGETVTVKNGTINVTGVAVSGNAIFEIGDNSATTTMTLENVNVIGDGYSSAYGVFYVRNNSALNVNNCNFDLKNEQHSAGGVFKADAASAILNITDSTVYLENALRGITMATTVINDSDVTIISTGETKAGLDNGVNRSALTVKGDSKLIISGGVGRGITAENGAISIEDTARVEVSDMDEATVELRGNQSLTIAQTALLIVDSPVSIKSGSESSTINGNVHTEHVWADATCTAPKTCTVCGETEGEALGHVLADATCTAPKTCTVCGATEGEALGHVWADATCTAPKTCTVCGATEGEVLEHVDADKDGKCDNCNATLEWEEPADSSSSVSDSSSSDSDSSGKSGILGFFKGCGGMISGVSLGAILLSGAGVLLFKKRKED